MAPLFRGQIKSRLDHGRGRGAYRGAGGSRGRGRAAFASRGVKRQTFESTRVEEKVEGEPSDAEEAINIDENQEESLDVSDSTSSEGDDIVKPHVQPYNVLLQSFANAQQGERKHKRRRVDIGSATGQEYAKSDLDHGEENVTQEVIDAMEETEEDEDTELDGVDGYATINASEGVTDDENDFHDPFNMHFEHPDEAELGRRVAGISQGNWKLWRDPFGHSYRAPVNDDSSWIGVVKNLKSALEAKLKDKLKDSAKNISSASDSQGSILISAMFSYQDLMHCHRTPQNADSLRKLTCLHSLNHVLKTRDRVIKNSARLSKDQGGEVELRDQGFTRPKVLMILPTRQSCVKMIDTITLLYEPEQQENKKRFQDSYVQTDDQFSEEKPEDFRELFGGNDDDMFRLGVKFTRKTMKYFSSFYNSDIIFASPLGLRMAFGSKNAKAEDHDFLSSIEIVIVDRADALLSQNWAHVEYIFEHLNLPPKEAHGFDISRVRSWYLNDNAKYLRQTILLSAFITPELNNIYTHNMNNVAGKIKFESSYDGAILSLGLPIKQRFSRYEAVQLATDPDSRFKYFTTAIVPLLAKTGSALSIGGQGVLIFIPSYLDFVRIRNYLSTSPSTQSISFGSISEYTSIRDVARARSHFFSGRHSVLLYTERAHHFRRYLLRNVKKVIMYGLPDNPIFYREIAGGYLGISINEGKIDQSEASIRSLFSGWDRFKLERIVGTKRCLRMLSTKDGDTFDFA